MQSVQNLNYKLR